MKITRRQIRRIIKEAINEVRPHNPGTEGYEMTAQSGVDYQFNKAFKQMHAFDADPSDIADMEEIRDLYYQDLPKGEASAYLKRLASGVDTIIREQIPQDVYYWIFPDLLENTVITRRQLRRIIKESMEDFGQKFDDAYKQPDGSYKGHPDEPVGLKSFKIPYKRTGYGGRQIISRDRAWLEFVPKGSPPMTRDDMFRAVTLLDEDDPEINKALEKGGPIAPNSMELSGYDVYSVYATTTG